MYTNHRHFGYASTFKRSLLGGIFILSFSLSSLYAGVTQATVPSGTTKTDANGINAKRGSNAVGISGTGNTTTIINNYYGSSPVKKPTKVPHPTKRPMTAKPKNPIPVVKPAKVIPQEVTSSTQKPTRTNTHSATYSKTVKQEDKLFINAEGVSF